MYNVHPPWRGPARGVDILGCLLAPQKTRTTERGREARRGAGDHPKRDHGRDPEGGRKLP